MRTLLELIKEEGLDEPPTIGAGFDMPNFNKEEVVKEIEDFLNKCDLI